MIPGDRVKELLKFAWRHGSHVPELAFLAHERAEQRSLHKIPRLQLFYRRCHKAGITPQNFGSTINDTAFAIIAAEIGESIDGCRLAYSRGSLNRSEIKTSFLLLWQLATSSPEFDQEDYDTHLEKNLY